MNHLRAENHSGSPSDRLPLFRPDVANRQGNKLYGDIILLCPISLTVLLWLALACIGSAVGLLAFGHYTNKAHVSGILLPDRGILKIYPGQAGTLVECRVRNGQMVRKGEVLFSLISDRSTMEVTSLGSEIRRELLNRRQSLMQERAMNMSLNAQQAMGLRDRLDLIGKQQTTLAAEIDTAKGQLMLAQGAIDKYRQLGMAKLISPLDLQQKEAVPLERQKALQELYRSQIALEGERKDLQSQLQRLPLEARVQSSALDRAISELEGQLSEHEVSQAAVVRAPADGSLSEVIDHPGTTVEQTTIIATLVPAHAKLEAHLYAASRAIGFVKPGNKVLLHYRAYPSEQFGQQMGVLSEISQVAMSPAEYASRTGATVEQPMYEMVVNLPAQVVTTYGQAQELRAGMELDADILLERRSLAEWFFRPILTFKGRLTG